MIAQLLASKCSPTVELATDFRNHHLLTVIYSRLSTPRVQISVFPSLFSKPNSDAVRCDWPPWIKTGCKKRAWKRGSGDEKTEEPAGGSGMVMRMVRFVSKMIKWSTPSKERHGEKIFYRISFCQHSTVCSLLFS